MNLTDLLRTDSGVLSVVGSGGKSTLVNELARELGCTVVIATSTHMLAPEGCPLLLDATELDVEQALWYTRVVCVGTRAKGADGAAGKLCAPSLGFGTLAVLADRVLVEDTDEGVALRTQVDDLHELICAYRLGLIKEQPSDVAIW